VKKVREKKYGENIREKKSTGKKGKTKIREKSREKRNEKKSKGTSHVTSGDVTAGQACAMVRSPTRSLTNAN
jgi:hypothetical protein